MLVWDFKISFQYSYFCFTRQKRSTNRDNNQNEGIHCLSNSASLHNHIYSCFYITFLKLNFFLKRVRPRILQQFYFRVIELVYLPFVVVAAQDVVFGKVLSIVPGSIMVTSYPRRVCKVFVNFSEILIVFFSFVLKTILETFQSAIHLQKSGNQ